MGGVDHLCGAASSRIWKLDVEDNAFAVLTNRKGVVGFLHSSWSEWKGYHFFVEAYGDRGMARAYYAPMSSILITMERPGGARHVRRNFYPVSIMREKLFGWQSTVIRAFVEEFQDFVALAKGQDASVVIARGEDGVRMAEIIEAVYRGAQGEAVALDPSTSATRKRGRRADG